MHLRTDADCFALAITLLIAAFLPACTPKHDATDQASLVLIGGGIEDDNVEVFADLLPAAPAPVNAVVVPYASAESAAAGSRMIERLTKFRPDGTYSVMPDPRLGQTQTQVSRDLLAAANMVFFTGGDQKRLIPIFAEQSGPSEPSAPTLISILESRAREQALTLGGTSAGAACWSTPMFLGGSTRQALIGSIGTEEQKAASKSAGNDDDDEPIVLGPRLGQGFGFVTSAIIDTHVLSRGRVGRMIAASATPSAPRFVLGLADNRAALYKQGIYTARGSRALLIVDNANLIKSPDALRGARVSLLSSNDQIHLPRKAARTAANVGNIHLQGTPPTPSQLDALSPVQLSTRKDRQGNLTTRSGPFDPSVLEKLLTDLARNPHVPQSASDDIWTLTLRSDSSTEIRIDNSVLRWKNVIVDITRKADIATRADITTRNGQ